MLGTGIQADKTPTFVQNKMQEKNLIWVAGETAQWVRALGMVCRLEDLSSDPQHHDQVHVRGGNWRRMGHWGLAGCQPSSVQQET